MIVREGKPSDGLDFTLAAGTLIHGVVTKRAGGLPLKGETITLVEHGQKLPPALGAVSHPNEVRKVCRSGLNDRCEPAGTCSGSGQGVTRSLSPR